MRFKSFSIIIMVSLGILFLNSVSCKQDKKSIQQTAITFKKQGELTIYKAETDSIMVQLDIEVADTDYDIQTGLMYRDAMKANQAMLFVFKDVTERYFYMKNTRIPLDLIYLGADKKIVSFQKNAKPFDETSLPSNVPAKYVLEVNAGLVDAWGIAMGDLVDFTQ